MKTFCRTISILYGSRHRWQSQRHNWSTNGGWRVHTRSNAYRGRSDKKKLYGDCSKTPKTTKTTSPFTSTDLVIKVGHGAQMKAISLCGALLDPQCPAWSCCSSFHQKWHRLWILLVMNYFRHLPLPMISSFPKSTTCTIQSTTLSYIMHVHLLYNPYYQHTMYETLWTQRSFTIYR